jgi:hypothetical protein
MMHGTRSGYNKGCRCPPCTAANTQAQRKWRRSLPSHALSAARGWESPEAGIEEFTANRSVSGGGVSLFDVLSATAEAFLANHPAVAAARTAAGAHAPMALPSATGMHSRTRDQLASRMAAISALPQLAPQVSRFIPPGCPAYRLIVNCGCPFGWGTPGIPSAVECPRHGPQQVLSSASADTWTGPLPAAVPA